MSIQEVGPRFHLGPFRMGRKRGENLAPGSEVTLYGFTDKHADYYATIARVRDPNSIQIFYSGGGAMEPGAVFEGMRINRESITRGRLHWVNR